MAVDVHKRSRTRLNWLKIIKLIKTLSCIAFIYFPAKSCEDKKSRNVLVKTITMDDVAYGDVYAQDSGGKNTRTIGGPKMRVFSSNILFLSKYLVSITCSNVLFRNFARAMLIFSRDICDVFLV